ncbi:hypothetical protein AMECASPLE_020847 [Ameca splendens]|uniref:Uncharacterized protein n=1 Tax=Ameca splendens TaxID=208324 RepID=A0ABV0XSJ3_9TELE
MSSRNGVFVLFSQTKRSRERKGGVGPKMKGAGAGSRKAGSVVHNLKKVEQIIDECSGKSMAESLLNSKGIRYKGDGMLLAQLNVVNTGLLLGVAEDESRGEGLGKKSQ